MKKLLILAILAFAAWQAWKNYPALRNPTPSHEVVVRNTSGDAIERLRITVGGQTFVKEALGSGESVAYPFRVSRDASFTVVWQWQGSPNELTWSGGMVPKGPMVQRHIIAIQGDGGVIYNAEQKEKI